MCKTDQKISIVMVDDDVDDCLLIKEALAESELDHTLTILHSGVELLDYLHGSGKFAECKPQHPGLILLDLYMPILSGKEVLGKMREDPELSHLNVAVLTDSSDWSELSECYRLGATSVFTKGQCLDTFAEMIRISGPYWFKFVTSRVDKNNIIRQ